MNEVQSVYEPVKLGTWSSDSFMLLVVVAEAPPELEDLRYISFCPYVLMSDSKRAIEILAFSSELACDRISEIKSYSSFKISIFVS